MTAALLIAAIGGWIVAALGWIAAWGADDQLVEERATLRTEVMRRMAAEEATRQAKASANGRKR